MKTRILNLIFFLTLIHGISFGQNQAFTEFNINYLNGTWKNVTEFRSVKLIYTKSNRIEKDYVGSVMKLKSNGEVVTQNYFKSGIRCGNDLSRIPRKGKWKFNKEAGILKMIMRNRISGGNPVIQSYKILELTNDKLILELITE